MKHCHISILCNELPFLKEKLPFLYKNFTQLIFVDYDIINKRNSIDGSTEFIKSYPDPENKIILIDEFDPSKINNYHGESFIEKQKMFAAASKYVKDDIDVVWATDLDEFFKTNLIKEVEELYNKDPSLVSIDLPHRIFVYNQYNYYNKSDFYIAPCILKQFHDIKLPVHRCYDSFLKEFYGNDCYTHRKGNCENRQNYNSFSGTPISPDILNYWEHNSL